MLKRAHITTVRQTFWGACSQCQHILKGFLNKVFLENTLQNLNKVQASSDSPGRETNKIWWDDGAQFFRKLR